MTENTRPIWPFPQNEEKVRWLLSQGYGFIKSITFELKDTDIEGNGTYVYTITNKNNESIVINERDEILHVLRLSYGKGVEFDVYLEDRFRNAIREIDRFNKENKDELAEYERLKRKFEPS